MNRNYYLTFTLNNLRYGVDTMAVQEIFYLPEITPVPEAPEDIVGIINLRGNIVPVMDLNIRFGYDKLDYHINDSVIILNWQELRVGIIANQVHEVKEILPSEITTELSYDQSIIPQTQEKFIQGIARKEKELVIVLELGRLLRYVEQQDLLTANGDSSSEVSSEEQEEKIGDKLVKTAVFFPHASAKERSILQKRADSLRQSLKQEELTGLKPFAVVKLGEEFFGVPLELVREFIKIAKVTPIPCTPPFIVGNMNLRGEVLTLLDLRGLLNLPMGNVSSLVKAMVVQVENIVAGIVVAGVSDVVLLNPSQMIEVPKVTHSINQEYLQGMVSYGEKILSILDLPKALLHGGLIVDEAV